MGIVIPEPLEGETRGIPPILPSVVHPSESASFSPPRWIGWLLALVPVFPPLYLVAFGALGKLRILPLAARGVLFFFAATQLVAALFTPQPLLSLGLAAARTLLILAMIAAGVYLRESRNLRPLLWGQLVICATAWGYTLLTQGWAGVQERLGHPYYYIVSLGLVAVIALWFVLFWRGGGWWRWPAGVLALATFLAAGSRGPFLALAVGSLAALAFGHRQRRRWVLIPAAAVLLIAISASAFKLPIEPVSRLFDEQTSGREYIWHDAIVGWQSSPLGGVGPYQGGPYLITLFQSGCQLTPTLERNKITCPIQLTRWSSVWLIAHNAWLHWLLESGLIGLSGMLLIMLYALRRSILLADPLVSAILFGYTAMNVVDVVIAVPSQHFTELWWVCIGLTFVKRRGI